MKTTIEIADEILRAARETARRRRTTLRRLVEEGLLLVVRRSPSRRRYQLPDTRFAGKGLQPSAGDGGWERLRDLSYEGRGA
jgi:hypothetical protein